MKDKFNRFVSKNIYKFEEITLSDNNIIKLEVSRDNFENLLNILNNTVINTEIEVIIYDEGIIKDQNDIILTKSLLESLNRIHLKNIKLILSDSTLPIYNHLMNIINWHHSSKTIITMKIFRNLEKEEKKWNLEQAQGIIEIPEEELIWVQKNELVNLENKIDKKILSDAIKLKEMLSWFENFMNETYFADEMDDFDKVYAIYKFVKTQIRLPFKYINVINGIDEQKENYPTYLTEPYSTFINKEGIDLGQSRLMTILLNNTFIKTDATTITGKTKQGINNWVGIAIDDKLYHCCMIDKGPFKNLSKIGYKIEKKIETRQIYPTIYKNAFLSEQEIKKIERKSRKLKR